MKYQVIRINPMTHSQYVVGTFDSLQYAELMKRTYIETFCPYRTQYDDVIKIIEVKDYYKNDIENACEHVVGEYHKYLNSENYNSITASKLCGVVEILRDLKDYVNYQL